MSVYTRFGDLVGQNLEEPQMLAFCPRGACYGCDMCVVGGNGSYEAIFGPGSPVPGSPASDCSSSSVETDDAYLMSPPVSPFPPTSEDSCSSFTSTSSSSTSTSSSWTKEARPKKSALRRIGAARKTRRVTWDPDTIFETRPRQSKRQRLALAASEEQNKDKKSNSDDAQPLVAPTPKRAKFVEDTTTCNATATFRPHIAPSSSRDYLPALRPDLARDVVPCFDFSSCLAITMTKHTPTTLASNAAEPASAPTRRETPLVAFSLVRPKAPTVSNLLACSSFKA